LEEVWNNFERFETFCEIIDLNIQNISLFSEDYREKFISMIKENRKVFVFLRKKLENYDFAM